MTRSDPLPARDQEVAGVRASESARAPEALGAGVLVVDDEPDFRLLVRLALEGHESVEMWGEASGVEEALEMLAGGQPTVVLVDEDLVTDDITGLAELQAAAPSAVFVLATAKGAAKLARFGADRPVKILSKAHPAGQLAERLAEDVRDLQAAPPVTRARRTFPPQASTVAAGRRFVRDMLEEHGASDLVETAILLVSELVTNAIVYARTACEVGVDLDEHRLRVAVTDDDRSPVRRRNARLEDASGRGIELVELLATAWGTDRTEAGKRLWFELERS